MKTGFSMALLAGTVLIGACSGSDSAMNSYAGSDGIPVDVAAGPGDTGEEAMGGSMDLATMADRQPASEALTLDDASFGAMVQASLGSADAAEPFDLMEGDTAESAIRRQMMQ